MDTEQQAENIQGVSEQEEPYRPNIWERISHLFEGWFQDPEEKAYLKQKEEKRMERIARQCSMWGEQDPHTFWDITELPRGIFVSAEPTKEDMKIHKYLIRKQECHIFYGKKFCYHQGEEKTMDIEQ